MSDGMKQKIEKFLDAGPGSRDQYDRKSVESLLEEINIFHQELQYQNQELRRIQQDLETSQRQYEELFELAPAAYVLFDENGFILYSNRAFREMTGYSSDSDKKQKFVSLISDISQNEMHFHLKELSKKGKAHSDRIWIRGKEPLGVVDLSSIWHMDGEKRLIHSVLLDITEREKAEFLYKISEEYGKDLALRTDSMDALFNYSAHVMMRVTGGHVFTAAMKTGEGDVLLLYSDASVVNRSAPSSGELDEMIRALYDQGLPSSSFIVFDVFFSERGESVPFLGATFPKTEGDILCIFLELPENKEYTVLEKSVLSTLMSEFEHIYDKIAFLRDLQDSEDRFAALLESVPLLIAVLQDRKIIYMNVPGLNLLGYSSLKDVTGRDVNEAVGFGTDLFSGEGGEVQVKSRDGAVKWLRVHVRTFTYGKKRSELLVCENISERKKDEEDKMRMREQLMISQKFESVGRLAGGIAHDFNNFLQGVIGYTSFLQTKTEPGSLIASAMKDIEEASMRSADLTRQLLSYARQQVVSPQYQNLNQTVSSTLSMLKRLLGDDIRLIWQPGRKEIGVNVDPLQIDQILTNLTVNARDAIENGGTITITTGTETLHKEIFSTSPDIADGQYAFFRVADDGKGIQKEVLENIFEPFFTTKELGKGTGMGLATVIGIIKQNKGHIQVESRPGSGSAFTVFLPLSEEESDGEAGLPKSDNTLGLVSGSEMLFLVEDDLLILDATSFMLEKLGYEVHRFMDPLRAFEKVSSGELRPDLIISDIMMPEINGFELHEKIRQYIPDIRFLYMTGYSDDLLPQNSDPDGRMKHIIKKPVSIQQLSVLIRRALDEDN